MKELPIDEILSALDKPTTGDNLTALIEAIGKADQFLQQCEKLMSRLDAMGLKPLLVRGAGAKLGIDAESPLKTEKPAFKSPTHQKYFEGINNLSEQELLKLMEGGKDAGAKP